MSDASTQVNHMPAFNGDQPFVQLTQVAHARRQERMQRPAARLVETDEESPLDHVLIDPLDDREVRCALHVGRH